MFRFVSKSRRAPAEGGLLGRAEETETGRATSLVLLKTSALILKEARIHRE